MNSFHTADADKTRQAKNAKQPFPPKIALYLKKVCYKVCLCECCQW